MVSASVALHASSTASVELGAPVGARLSPRRSFSVGRSTSGRSALLVSSFVVDIGTVSWVLLFRL